MSYMYVYLVNYDSLLIQYIESVFFIHGRMECSALGQNHGLFVAW